MRLSVVSLPLERWVVTAVLMVAPEAPVEHQAQEVVMVEQETLEVVAVEVVAVEEVMQAVLAEGAETLSKRLGAGEEPVD